MVITHPIRVEANVLGKLVSAVRTDFPREARSPGWAERRLNTAEYTQGFTSLPSTPLLQVPGLQSSVEAMEAAAHQTARRLPSTSSQAEFDRDVISHLSGPPSAADEQAEIKLMLGLQRTRTPLDERIAGYYANGPALDWFDAQAASITKRMSIADAAIAQKLLDQTFDAGHSAVHEAKQIWQRHRPIKASSEIHTSAYMKEDSGSYVSGHTANAVGMGHVLAALDPANAARYLGVAHEMAHARVVAGAHFPSDTAAGAYIGTRAALRTLERNADVVASIRARMSA